MPAGSPDADPFCLDGRRALVTGASRGIGAVVARALAAAGADLVLSARGPDDLGRVVDSIAEEHGVRVVPLPADLSDAPAVEDLATRAHEALGGIDVLVNNAGISIPEPVTALTSESWDAMMSVNLRAPAPLSARVGAAMADAGGPDRQHRVRGRTAGPRGALRVPRRLGTPRA